MLASLMAQILGAARCAGGLLALMLLGACGQKGPLYLPAETSPTSRNAQPPAPAGAASPSQAPASK